jgi:hypothetical protein
MTRQKFNTLLMTALALLCGAQAVHAEDFNFTIPVRMSNIPPNVTSLNVMCYVVLLPPGAAAPTSQIALGSTSQRIAGGAFIGNLVVRVNAQPGKPASSATHYKCTGSFHGTDSGYNVGYFVNGGRSDRPFPLAPGSAFNLDSGYRPLPR